MMNGDGPAERATGWGGSFFVHLTPGRGGRTLAEQLGPVPANLARYPMADLRTAPRRGGEDGLRPARRGGVLGSGQPAGRDDLRRGAGMGSRVFDVGFLSPMEDLSLDIRRHVGERLERKE